MYFKVLPHLSPGSNEEKYENHPQVAGSHFATFHLNVTERRMSTTHAAYKCPAAVQ